MPWVLTSFALYLWSLFAPRLLPLALAAGGSYLLYRALSMGRLPLIGVHDTLFFTAWCTALAGYLLAGYLRENSRRLRSLAALLAAIFTAFSALAPRPSYPLPPILKTLWFELHVISAFISYGLFGVAALLGLLYLRAGNNAEEKLFPLQYRAVLAGYLLFSFSMITGGVWAFLAWGTYWIWTPKELWTAILWLTYTLYLHLRFEPRPLFRATSGPGWRAFLSWMSLGGYGVVLFTYLGVGLLMRSSHSF